MVKALVWAELSWYMIVGKLLSLASPLPLVSRDISGDRECILQCGCRLKRSCYCFVSKTETWYLEVSSAQDFQGSCGLVLLLFSLGGVRSTRRALNFTVP